MSEEREFIPLDIAVLTVSDSRDEASDKSGALLRGLLEERVSIRNIFLILETVGEAKSQGAPMGQIVELVRQRLSFQILNKLQDGEGRLPLVQLSTSWEQKFAEHEIKSDAGATDIALPPELFTELLNGIQEKLNETASRGVVASIATSSKRRRFLQTVLASKGIRNAVLAYEEIKSGSKPQIVGIV